MEPRVWEGGGRGSRTRGTFSVAHLGAASDAALRCGAVRCWLFLVRFEGQGCGGVVPPVRVVKVYKG